MASCDYLQSPQPRLDVPEGFEDLVGLLEADLKAIVLMIATRAQERLLLGPREGEQLRGELWSGLTDVVQGALRPLSVECR
jgi:hypothetical protein